MQLKSGIHMERIRNKLSRRQPRARDERKSHTTYKIQDSVQKISTGKHQRD